MRLRRLILPLAATAALAGTAAGPAADHAWANYHWAGTGTTFTLTLGDNVSSAWDPYLDQASTDWSGSSVLDTSKATGTVTNLKRCTPPTGRVEVCNATYGNNGWLGLAQIWASGDHITKGAVKVNDSYFNTSSYNKAEWRRMVMCQEVGHTFGLGHQDENQTNTNLGTCMDYTSNPLGPPSNVAPNTHDYDQLVSIYAHVDSTTTVGAAAASPSAAGAGNSRAEWGTAVRYSRDGKPSLFARDLGNGEQVFTFVTWAE